MSYSETEILCACCTVVQEIVRLVRSSLSSIVPVSECVLEHVCEGTNNFF